ncbi:universal stress protein [Rhodopseudomonas palustris]|uniref:Universal stress protein n=1 Tax=Rhodopseudomonas palustris TaxID=1076 RepID=A0A418VI36_RHOPL|nr:universal stress protein [Rhodopseudomonas palustris]RJF75807.1 universal stress protein [Rhodopseudomonas palustris]
MIKDLIVNLESNAARDRVVDVALAIARAFDAHVSGVCFAYDSLPSFTMPDFPSEVLTKMLAANEAAARLAVERFETACKREGVSAAHHLLETPYGTSGRFPKMARRFDLSVIMQSDPENGDNDVLIEQVLFDSGRPVLIVPYIQKDAVKLDRVVCCWDGSRAATRAINDARPFLRRAAVVELLIVRDQKVRDDSELRGIEMANHLARHGIKLDIKVITAPDIGVAGTILSHVADTAADLLVMGGYGHSRLREFVLGGVTREMLASMTVPVVMSH